MTAGTRFLLIFMGLGVSAVGVIGLHFKWAAGTPAVLLAFGLVMIVIGTIGSMPNMSFKEGQFLWPDPKVYERLDELEKALEAEKEYTALLEVEAENQEEVMDYILSRMPSPPDDGEYESDQERLEAWEEGLAQTTHEISVRHSTGEGYDDGISVEGLEMMRDDTRRDIRLEQRRLKAKKRFALPRYDGHHPTRDL